MLQVARPFPFAPCAAFRGDVAADRADDEPLRDMTGHLARNLLEKGSEKRWTHGLALALRYSVRIRIGLPRHA